MPNKNYIINASQENKENIGIPRKELTVKKEKGNVEKAQKNRSKEGVLNKRDTGQDNKQYLSSKPVQCRENIENYRENKNLVYNVDCNSELSRNDDINKSISDVEEEIKELLINTEESTKDKVNEIFKEVDHIINHKVGLLFNKKKDSPSDTVFEWSIQDIKQCFDAGKSLESLKFCCKSSGHQCHMYSEFEDEDTMGINLEVSCGENNESVETFDMNVTFEVVKSDGTKIAFPSSNNIIIENYALYFGDGNLKRAELADFITDNSCTIICTLSSDA